MQYFINKEEVPYFVFDKTSSTDFNMIVTKVNNLDSTNRNLEFTVVPGRDGEYVEEKELPNKEISVEFYIDSESTEDINRLAKDIKKWLQNKKGYKELFFSDDIETIYEAICINKVEIEEVIEALGEGKIYFSCKPYTKSINNNTIIITNSTTIYNQYSRSLPKIKIFGSGDVTISINNNNLILKGIEEFIEVDCDEMECYKTLNGITTYLNNKMYSDFPVLEEGNNNISWIGNIRKIEIIPNWIER